jgi:hypothetical protein
VTLWNLVIGLTAAALLAGCSSSEEKAPPPQEAAFDLEGWRLIACCCGSPCSCRLNKKPHHCHGCDHTDVVHIDRGHLGGTDMAGMTWVIAGRGFGEDPKGNWVYVYVTDKASDAQVAAIQGMLNDSVKGWGDRAAHLAGKFIGLRKAPVDVKVDTDGLGWACAIPDVLDLRTRAIFNPGHTKPVTSEGIMDSFGDSFIHADPLAHSYGDKTTGYRWDLKGRQANFAKFHLTPAHTGKGGWGCWTAHSTFGDTGLYQEQMRDE